MIAPRRASRSASRRSFLASLGAIGLAGVASSACRRPEGEKGLVRVGYQANLTHAPFLVGVASGRFGAVLGAIGASIIEARTFRAGPRIAEALVGGAIDVGVLGPLAAASLEARHPGSIKVVSGCASGGSSFVVVASITKPAHLSGKRVAAPQLGSMPDIALRSWLVGNGLDSIERGGSVAVDALAPADALLQMKRGQLAGAWIPEPWATRIVNELPATRMIDERDLWPDRRFPAAIVVVRRAFADARRAELDALTKAASDEIDRALSDPATARAEVNAELARLTTKPLPAALLEEAWSRVDFTHDALAGCFPRIADEARALGYLPDVDTSRLFTMNLLRRRLVHA